MRVLLDTHVFIWWNSDNSKLSPKVQQLIEDENNEIVLSVVSAWEIQIKAQLGKLPVLPASLNTIISRQQNDNGLVILPVRLPHVFALDGLPFHHKDPFDRMLIAQALSENLPFVTHDAVMSQYAVTVIW
jgi:PIN domain nuclease of toxin-antitoxin system